MKWFQSYNVYSAVSVITSENTHHSKTNIFSWESEKKKNAIKFDFHLKILKTWKYDKMCGTKLHSNCQICSRSNDIGAKERKEGCSFLRGQILIFVSHPLDNLAVRITFFLQQSYVFFVFNRFFLKFIYIINVFKK